MSPHPDWARDVGNYETKLIKRSCALSLQFAESYCSDFAAMRAAKTLSRAAGDTVQVRRGDVCIYSDGPKPARLVWSVR